MRESKEIDRLEDIGINGESYKMDHQETGWDMYWTNLIHRRDR